MFRNTVLNHPFSFYTCSCRLGCTCWKYYRRLFYCTNFLERTCSVCRDLQLWPKIVVQFQVQHKLSYSPMWSSANPQSIPTDCVRVRTQISAVRSCLEIFPNPPLPAWPQKSVGPSPRALPYQLPRADPPLVFSRLWPDTALLFRNRIGNEIQQTIPGYPLISQVFSIDSNWTSLGFHHIEPAETSDNPSPPGSPPCPFSALPGTSSPTFPPT